MGMTLTKQMEAFLRGNALKDFAESLCNRLVEKGIIVHRYDAYSTNSIYLKLDYGVCNSIRISDHKGKGYLKYRYNIGFDIERARMEQDKYPRFYYPVSEQDALLSKIMSDRDDKLRKYGQQRYAQYMRENKTAHSRDKGFWSQSYQVF